MKSLNNIRITGPKVDVVPITMEYDSEIFNNFTKEITTYMCPAPAENIEQTQQFISSAVKEVAEGVNFQAVIIKKETGEFLGCCGAHKLNTSTPELGIWLKKAAHGVGYGPEAVHLVYNWLEKNYSFEYAVYPVDRRNSSSVRIAESLGGIPYKESKETGMGGNELDLIYFKIDPHEIRYTFFFPNQMNLQDSFVGELWPAFMLKDPIASENWVAMFQGNLRSQILAVKNGEAIAAANSIAVCWNGEEKDLQDRGWDWAMETGSHLKKGERPDTLCGLQIGVRKEYQGQGISGRMIQELKKSASARGLKRLIIPVRPIYKCKYPLIPMEEYITWKNEKELPFDPWLRTHVRQGGKILHCCPEAMTIPGTPEEWEEWTGMRFPQTGLYTIPGALCPVWIDREEMSAEYVEPNVWVQHSLPE